MTGNEFGVVIPKQQLAYTGTSVLITCYSKSKPVWSKDYVLLAAHLRVLETIILRNIQESDGGYYQCSGTYANRSRFDVTAKVLVGGRLSLIFI